jgi:glycine cleavage system regulatory protein
MMQFARELFPNRQGIEIALAMRDDLVSNLVRNPLGLVRAGNVARTVDLRDELSELHERGIPVLALTTDADGVVPREAFEALCSAVGAEGRILSGRHSWLLTEPDSFDAVLANVVEVRVNEHQERSASTRAAQVLDALRPTNIPARRARGLLRDAPPLWLLSAPTDLLAADLALCHPALAPGEVRAVAREIDGSAAVRLTVAAEDRRGLLADTTAVLARHGLAITDASAATWSAQRLALHALTINQPVDFATAGWDRLGEDLRAIGNADARVRTRFMPLGRAHVTVAGDHQDQTLVRVVARDQIGLLATICRYFADRGLSVESVHAATDGATARDVFVITGECCAADLARRLSR